MAPEKKDETKTKDEEKKKEEVKKEVVPVPPTVAQEIKSNLLLIDRAVHTIEPRFTARVLRTLTTLRKKLDGESLKEVVEGAYPKVSTTRTHLLTLTPLLRPAPTPAPSSDTDAMEVDSAPKPAAASPEKKKEPTKEVTEILPEADVYLRLLIGLGLVDAGAVEKAYELFKETTELIQSVSRRSMDHLAAKVYFYYARSCELSSSSPSDLRATLLTALSTASLRHDEDLQGTLINLLLRNYFQTNLYDQADKLLSKTTFPESCGNAQLGRYLFYLGRIRAVQLNYTESHTHLQHALRRAPPATVAPGFVQTVYKFFVVVELLMGDIPERSIFRRPVLRKALAPYFQIVQAVRVGDLEAFQTALTTHSTRFFTDGTHSLILRLRHNVIKTALRMISLAYSRISLKDICVKLHLDSEEDTEYIVAKAIRDGVIDAEVDHKGGWMKSREVGDVYETEEPQKAFQQRIDFCMGLHNDTIKAMRYPLSGHKRVEDESELNRERMLDIEAAIAEAQDDDDAMDGF